MYKIKPFIIVLLLFLLIISLCQELYKQSVYNQAMKEFCIQKHVGQTVAEISAIISKSDQLKIYKDPDQANLNPSKITIFPKKPSLDVSVCQLEIKENQVVDIHYFPADHENSGL